LHKGDITIRAIFEESKHEGLIVPFTYKYPHPAVTVDIVVYTLKKDDLKVLLIKRAMDPYRGAWALPGGFVDLHESLEEAARRELEEETSLSGVQMEQLYTFGHPDRDPRERVITVAYCAGVPSETPDLCAGSDAAELNWFSLENLPELAFDHSEILRMARVHIAERLG
jgi:8-oxo-dGTP diphosphatase